MTDSQKPTTRTEHLDTTDGAMETFIAEPDRDATTAVVVIQEAFGLNDHIRSVTERCARDGLYAVAPAVFHRAGGGTAAYGDMPAVFDLVEGLTDDGALSDVDACVALLASVGFTPDRIAVIGFCMGGRLTFMTALRRRFGAAVTFYGSGIVEPGRLPFPALFDEVDQLQTPWLGLFGGRDPSIPNEQVDRLEAALATVETDHEIVRYAEAGHAFNCDERPDNYNPEVAADAWKRMQAWIADHIR